MSAKREFIYTPSGCPHGPPLPKEGKRFCVSCQPGGIVEFHARPVVPLPVEMQGDPYLTDQPCASPHADPVTVDGVTPPGFARAKRHRENR